MPWSRCADMAYLHLSRLHKVSVKVPVARVNCPVRGNNHFGIKATSSWIENGGKYLVYTDDRPNEKFCQYANVGDSYEHHSQFLKRNGRYAGLFQLSPDDYKGWTNGLQDAGYASSKQYAATLQNIIEKNGLQKI